MVRWVIGSILRGGSIELFLVPNQCSIGKSSTCGGSEFPLSLSEWTSAICLMPYNRKQNVLSTSLNKTFPSVLQTERVLSASLN